MSQTNPGARVPNAARRIDGRTGLPGRSAFLSIAVLSASFLMEPSARLSSCYHMTETCNGSTKDLRKGEALTNTEMAGVQAAIDMLYNWTANCGVMGPAGSRLLLGPAESLQEMMDNGQICRETSADGQKVGASSSNRHTGNGPTGPGCSVSTTGDPGLNIHPNQIPKPDANGDFNPRDVASLAGQLLHELQHLLNPNNSANNQREYEEPAYRETIKQLCKVAGCMSASQEEKDAVCEYILASNKELCRLGAEQECCMDCPDEGKIHCEGNSGGASGGGGGGGRSMLGGGHFLDTTVDEFYALNDIRGHISLNVAFQQIRFTLWDFSQATEFTFDCSEPKLSFTATAFTRIGPTTLLVGGFDSSTFEGELVRVEFDPYSGQVLWSNSELTSPAFATVGSMDRFPNRPRVAFLDHLGNTVFVYDHAQGVLQAVADANDAPLLAELNYVHVWKHPGAQGLGRSGGGGRVQIAPLPLNGFEIWATYYTERSLSDGVLIGNGVHMIDANGDGTFETIL